MQPIAKFDQEGQATVVKYDMPDCSSLRGRNYIALNVDNLKFKTDPSPPSQTERNIAELFNELEFSVLKDLINPPPFLGHFLESQLKQRTISLPSNPPQKVATQPFNLALKDLEKKRLFTYKSITGKPFSELMDSPSKIAPTLVLVERCAVSTFLGQYGAGKVLKTFSLFPGERAKITISSYRKSEETKASSASVLDSISETNTKEIQESLTAEKGTKTSKEKEFSYHAETEAEASWGWGSAKVSAGVKGGTKSAREECSKNVKNFAQNTANQSSSKRDVQVNTSYQAKTEEGESSEIERVFENVNVSRSLNFIFRQMNQEYVSVNHLYDVRLLYFDAQSKKEVPISQMRELLDDVVKEGQAEEVNKIYKWVINELKGIKDFYGLENDFVEEVKTEDSSYYRIKDFSTPVYGTPFQVPGIILNIFKTVMRTEGVIVDAVLGNGEGLDDYSKNLQQQTIRTKKLDNDIKELAIEIIKKEEDPAKQAELFKRLLVPDTIINK